MATTIDDLFPSRYLKAADLKGESRVVIISKIASEEVGKAKERKTVVYFQKCTKGLILNKTNAKKIADVVGSKIIADWPGKEVILYVKPDVEFGGELGPAIRVNYPTVNGAAGADEKAAPPAAIPEADEDLVFGDPADRDIPDFPASPGGQLRGRNKN